MQIRAEAHGNIAAKRRDSLALNLVRKRGDPLPLVARAKPLGVRLMRNRKPEPENPLANAKKCWQQM